MKKIIFLISSVLFLNLGSTAQDEPTGVYAIDINFNPAAFFDAFSGSMFEMPQIQGRYFLASDMAVRLGLNIGYGSDKEITDLDGDDYIKNTNMMLGIAPGLEKHYGTRKFKVIVGGEVPIATTSNKTVSKTGDITIKQENASGSGYISFGLHAVLGGEFYITPNFYIGAEFTPGLMYYNYKDQVYDGDVVDKNGSSMTFGLSSASGLKIGFRF